MCWSIVLILCVAEVPLNGLANATRDDLEKWTIPLLNEFLHNVDYDETLKEVGEKFSPGTIEQFVEIIFNEVIERTEKARSTAGALLATLVKKHMVTEKQYLGGLNTLLSIAEDLLVDIPKFWDFLAHIVAPVIANGSLPLNILKESATTANLSAGDMGKRCASAKYVAAVLHEIVKSGQNNVTKMWSDSGLQWSDLLAPDTKVEEFLLSNKLEWTVAAAGDLGGDTTELSDETLGKELLRVLESNRYAQVILC